MEFNLSHINKLKEDDFPAALCIIISVKGSVPRKKGVKMLVKKQGDILGTIGGGNLEKQVIKDALSVIEKNEPQVFKHQLLHHLDMCCGGTVQIYIEPLVKKRKLYIFGAGHTGKALSEIASGLDFDVFVIDDRKSYLNKINLPNEHKICLPFNQALKILPFDYQTYITILTYSHPYDRNILFHCIKQPFKYLGMIGSQRKVAFTKKLLLESEHVEHEIINKVDMPIGIDIGAESPYEIALSIVSKIIVVKNKEEMKINNNQKVGNG